jgi:phospholipid/cholesterol/gamma-HCH transport system substrate-binding protein
MTAARAAALGGLLIAVVLLAVLLLGGESTTTYKLRFATAGQLVDDNDVQIGGRRIGSVADIKLTQDNQAEVVIEVSDEFAPLHEGTTAQIRATSLSGVANRYVQLRPGPNNAEELEDGTLLDTSKTESIVDLDQLFNTLDAKTRRALQRVIQGSAEQFGDKGDRANEAAEYFNPALSTTRNLVSEVNRDSQTLSRLLVDGGRAMTALAERRTELTDLVSNANNAAAGIAQERTALSQALAQLPDTMRRGNSTFVNLRAALNDLDELVDESKPATKDLARFMRELRPLVQNAQPTVRNLQQAVRRAGEDNDLVELTNLTPRLQQVASPSLKNTSRALENSVDVLDFARPYSADLVGWLRDFGAAAANYDANGHYARVAPVTGTFDFTDDANGGTLTPQNPNTRLQGSDLLRNSRLKRCPGTASQPADDGSAPFRDDDLDCDASSAPSGP